MPAKRTSQRQLFLLLLLTLMVGLLVACSSDQPEPTPEPGVHTWLLVTAPQQPLPLNRPINVKSRTEDAQNQVSHVELYAVEWPRPSELSSGAPLLLRSDAATFDQTTFTASQVFTPTQSGHYVIKVVGYNKLGYKDESDYLGFDVQ